NVGRLGEGNAFGDQIIRCFRGEKGGIGWGRFKSLGIKLGGGDSTRRNRKHVRDLIVRGKKRLFVLLKIALITRRQALQRRDQADQCPGDASGFAADQFPCVGIFLLWHEAAAGGKVVGKNHVRKFLRREDDEIIR